MLAIIVSNTTFYSTVPNIMTYDIRPTPALSFAKHSDLSLSNHGG